MELALSGVAIACMITTAFGIAMGNTRSQLPMKVLKVVAYAPILIAVGISLPVFV